ncbi:Endonuclease/exonuclease/phosphatase, partial [Anaeromyces robustus]
MEINSKTIDNEDPNIINENVKIATEKQVKSINEEDNIKKDSTNQICNSNSSSEGEINLPVVDKDKVRILTYNIFMRPPPIHSFESDFKEDRIKLICKELFQNFDIIAFQECFSFGSFRIDKIKEKAKKNGLVYFSNSKKKHTWNIGIDGGLCLLSRYPVINKKLYYFKNGCHSDAYSEKGVLFNEIEIPNGNHLFIFTSHTQASYEHFPSITSESVRVRLSQFTEIRKFITSMTENAKPTDIILLCGDLNVNGRLNKDDGTTHSEEYKAVLSILKGNLSIIKKEKEKDKEKDKEKEKEKGKGKEKEKEKEINKEVNKDSEKEEKEKENMNENINEKDKIKENENENENENRNENKNEKDNKNNDKDKDKDKEKVKEKENKYVEIISETAEYEVEDLFYNELNEHPVTSCDLFADDYYKDGKGKKSRKCLDYFFTFKKLNAQKSETTSPEVKVTESESNNNNNNNNNNTSNVSSKVVIKDLTINKFDVTDKKFVHLSDHYGLSLNIVT